MLSWLSSPSSRRLLLASLLVATTVSTAAQAAPKGAPSKPASTHPSTDADKDQDKDKPSASTAKKAETKPEPVLENVITASPEDLVNKPQEYLGKNVKLNANFFAWSNLALDYKPAFRSSKTHLSFLILKPNGHIPLSELKLAIMIPKEKDSEAGVFATLKDGDQVEMVGKVFSTALDDPWVEVFKLKKIGGSSDDKDKDKDKKSASAGDKDDKSKDDKSKDDKSSDSKSGDSKSSSDKPGSPAKPDKPDSTEAK
jgi:hypothetical protein